MTIARRATRDAIRAALSRSPVAVLTGPRQCGKTTLARQLLPEDSANYLDLEDPVSLARLDEPMTALGPLQGLVVIDEIQRRPDLFPVLRVLADRRGKAAHLLILSSASGDLLRQSSESRAGRMERIAIGGFCLAELGSHSAGLLWRRGGLPLAYLARTERDSLSWRKQFIQTRPCWNASCPSGARVPAVARLRFWTMVAHYHGQTWNAADPGQAGTALRRGGSANAAEILAALDLPEAARGCVGGRARLGGHPTIPAVPHLPARRPRRCSCRSRGCRPGAPGRRWPR